MLRNHDDAFVVADDDVAGIDRDAAAADRHVEVDRVVVDEVERRASAGAVDREIHRRDGAAVAHRSVGDEPRRAAHLEARRQDLAARGDAGFAAAVEHQHVPGRHALDGLALRMLGVLEALMLVEVLARRDVAHRERGADQIAAGGLRQPRDALDEDVAKAALEKLRAQRGDADVAQLLQRFGLDAHPLRWRNRSALGDAASATTVTVMFAVTSR